jgi:hypothetical protein
LNEWKNLLLTFFTLGPTMLVTRLKDDSTRIVIFNRASYPVNICFSFFPPCPTPFGKDMSRIRYSIVPYPGFYHAPVQPLPPPPPFFQPEPPNPHLFATYPICLTNPIFFPIEMLPIVLSLSVIHAQEYHHVTEPKALIFFVFFIVS